MSAFATFLREEMARRGMTLTELEVRSGVPDSTLSRILNGTVEEPKASVIAQIAKGLEMPFWRLMQHAGYTAEMPGEPTTSGALPPTALRAAPGRIAHFSIP